MCVIALRHGSRRMSESEEGEYVAATCEDAVWRCRMGVLRASPPHAPVLHLRTTPRSLGRPPSLTSSLKPRAPTSLLTRTATAPGPHLDTCAPASCASAAEPSRPQIDWSCRQCHALFLTKARQRPCLRPSGARSARLKMTESDERSRPASACSGAAVFRPLLHVAGRSHVTTRDLASQSLTRPGACNLFSIILYDCANIW